MRLSEVWRYPVKSLQGEQLTESAITPQGVVGDRAYALFDARTGLGLTARRVPELLFAYARLQPDGGVRITLPDGSDGSRDDALSSWLGRPVALRSTSDVVSRRYENPSDFEDEGGKWTPFDGSGGAFHDEEKASVSLVSTATIGEWDRRRFRANLILDGAGEDDLVGSDVTIGDAVLRVGMQIHRCVMTTRPQPDGVARDLDVLRTIHRERSGCVAVGALVSTTGTVRVGDPVGAVRGLRARLRSLHG